ncbi:DUF3769 domain-containing protein [Cephalotus follicularis]|uniref:DUF3769 domain-containing protein n=1 Tax=Cephalotus follicularis TaxID=3775 RepID=A0A1Q3BV04_CEPFO|nr:DUF3769 domain-containing protein [Cephalotus follicularis]
MANLETAMDSAFWDQNIASPKTLEGMARSIPGDPFPLDAGRASRALRIQQLSLLGLGFPFGIIPSYSSTATSLRDNKDNALGSFSLQSLIFKTATSSSNWWLGIIGQFRPKKLISSIKAELSNADELELPTIKEAAKHFLDKSLYSIGLCTQLSLSPSSSLLWATQRLGEEKKPRHKLIYYHQLPDHYISLEAAWPELFMDHKGGYWEVPESISLDMASHTSESGLRYRFGLHKSSGHPQAFDTDRSDAPSALKPGLCAKAAFSYEKSRDIWRQKQHRKDIMVKTDKGWNYRPSYDSRLSEPHAAISGILGGTCAAWLGGRQSSTTFESQGGDSVVTTEKSSPVNADLFGSVCYTFQHGKFRKLYGDLTRLDARLDICSASALAKRVFNNFRSSSASRADCSLSSPRLNLIFQQQVAGPIVFRVDSRFMLDSSSGKVGPQMEDLICSLSYSLRLLHSGKVVAWYSPKRKEGMIELRLFEF